MGGNRRFKAATHDNYYSMHPSWHLDINKPRYSLLGSYKGVGGSRAGATWLCVVGFLIQSQSAPDGVSSSFGAISRIGFIQNASHVMSNGLLSTTSMMPACGTTISPREIPPLSSLGAARQVGSKALDFRRSGAFHLQDPLIPNVRMNL